MSLRAGGPPVGDDRGFTLVELLVAMIVIGVFASIAVPTLLTAQRKAYETSAKSDVKAITKEVQTLYADGSGSMTVTGSDGTWTISRGGVPVATGELSRHNVVSSSSSITDAGQYCLSVRNTKAGAQYWTADDVGLRAGDCTTAS